MPSISPENWQHISTSPEFGSLIDQFGGRSKADDKMRGEGREIRVDVLRETEDGLVEYHANKNGLKVYSERLGADLSYDTEGKLKELVIDVLDYCGNNFMDEEYQEMGGENLDTFLEEIMEAGEIMTIKFDLKKKQVQVVVVDDESLDDKGRVIGSKTEHNFSEQAVIALDYKKHMLCVLFEVREDELRFGMAVMEKINENSIDVIERTSILTDCNYMTFLESKAEDKYERLAKRIFLRG